MQSKFSNCTYIFLMENANKTQQIPTLQREDVFTSLSFCYSSIWPYMCVSPIQLFHVLPLTCYITNEFFILGKIFP